MVEDRAVVAQTLVGKDTKDRTALG
jgi:hypothetical protein